MWFVGVALVQISKERFCQLVGGTLDERGDADHLVHIEAHLYTLSEQLFDLMKTLSDWSLCLVHSSTWYYKFRAALQLHV